VEHVEEALEAQKIAMGSFGNIKLLDKQTSIRGHNLNL
jgi:hypothetical protein